MVIIVSGTVSQGNRAGVEAKHSHQGEAVAGSLKELWALTTDAMQDEAAADAQGSQNGVASAARDEQMAVIHASITPAVEAMLMVGTLQLQNE